MNLGICCGDVVRGEWAEDNGTQRLFSRYVLARAPSPARVYRGAAQETRAASVVGDGVMSGEWRKAASHRAAKICRANILSRRAPSIMASRRTMLHTVRSPRPGTARPAVLPMNLDCHPRIMQSGSFLCQRTLDSAR